MTQAPGQPVPAATLINALLNDFGCSVVGINGAQLMCRLGEQVFGFGAGVDPMPWGEISRILRKIGVSEDSFLRVCQALHRL